MNPSRHTWFLAVVVLAAVPLSCVERQVDRDKFDPRVRCSYIAVYVTVEDETFRLADSETGASNTKVCTCATHDEFLDPDYREGINDMAYEACLEFVADEGYEAEQSSCQADYEAGVWAQAYGVGETFSEEPAFCDEAPVGCGVE